MYEFRSGFGIIQQGEPFTNEWIQVIGVKGTILNGSSFNILQRSGLNAKQPIDLAEV
jgi:hypothetical protein